jgi:hypothetical protein
LTAPVPRAALAQNGRRAELVAVIVGVVAIVGIVGYALLRSNDPIPNGTPAPAPSAAQTAGPASATTPEK